MSEPNLQAIAERLDKVEKHNRYIRLAVVALLSVVAVSLLAGAGQERPKAAKEIEAEIIKAKYVWAEMMTVVDANGESGIQMTNLDNTAHFTMSDPNGRTRLDLIADHSGAKLSLLDAKGKKQVDIMGSKERSGLNLYSNSKQIASFDCFSGSGSGLAFYDHSETRRLYLAATDKESYLWMDDSHGRKQVRFGSQWGLENPNRIETHRAYMILYNKTGEPTIQLHSDEYGNGVVGAYNRKGIGRELKPGP